MLLRRSKIMYFSKSMKASFFTMAMVLACATSFGQGVLQIYVPANPGDETPPGPGALIITNTPAVPADFTTTISDPPTQTFPGPNLPTTITLDNPTVNFPSMPDSSGSSDSLITPTPEPSAFALVGLGLGLIVIARKKIATQR
jgi:hypothetical protein